MKHGFHQIPLAMESRPITAMSTPIGPRQWKVMPMGVTNGVAVFQRLMDTELQDIDYADPYVDDVLIGSSGNTVAEAIENHYKDLRRVLDRFARDKLVVDLKKAHFFYHQGGILWSRAHPGHKVSRSEKTFEHSEMGAT